MAPRPRILPHACSAAILLAAMTNAPAAWAEPASRPTTARVAPVARVDLGAPDPRCTDLAYPLWDDGMCVRAKCADDDACDFSRIAAAQTPPTPPGLAPERWLTATARPAASTPARFAPTQFARARDRGRAAGLPLLAEARTLPIQTRPASRESAERAHAHAKPARPAERPSLWDRIRAAIGRLWRKIAALGRSFTARGQAPWTGGDR